MAGTGSGMLAQSHLGDRPTSRLSKRITRWPRAASAAQKSSSQRIICAARPIMRRSGRPSGAPKVSYAISMPLARAVGMRPSPAELAGGGQALAATESERLECTRSEGRRRPPSSQMERVGGAGIGSKMGADFGCTRALRLRDASGPPGVPYASPVRRRESRSGTRRDENEGELEDDGREEERDDTLHGFRIGDEPALTPRGHRNARTQAYERVNARS